MQLSDLVKPIDECTDEELMERLRQSRHNRTISRPAAKTHARKAAKKGQQGRLSKASSMLDGLTPEQKAQLILELGG